MRLIAQDLACVRGIREIFSAVSFDLPAGQALLLTGPNGAGKTSLLRIIAGLLRAADGRLTLEGGDPDLTLGEQAHYLGHLDPQKPSLTVGENLEFWARYLGPPDGTIGAAVGAALAAVGLSELRDLPAAYLSAGQRRRLSLARLVACYRPIWLLDEPTSVLDAASQDRLTDLMGAHLTKGGLIIAATHGALRLAPSRELKLGGP